MLYNSWFSISIKIISIMSVLGKAGDVNFYLMLTTGMDCLSDSPCTDDLMHCTDQMSMHSVIQAFSGGNGFGVEYEKVDITLLVNISASINLLA